MNRLEACSRCAGGRIVTDLAGERTCINCGAPPPGTPAPVLGSNAIKGTNVPRWDRTGARATSRGSAHSDAA